MGNIAKLRMSAMFRQVRELGLEVLGARGMLHDYGDGGGPAAGLPADIEERARATTAVALWSPAPSIYGGTDEVQRNILAERILGLPRDPQRRHHVRPFARCRRTCERGRSALRARGCVPRSPS